MKKTIYHGSKYIIDKPSLKQGKKTNDFGQGFYCTEDIELAKEWACQKNNNGYANIYELDMDGLKVLDLQNGDYSVLNWIAILLKNRKFDVDNPTVYQVRKYIIKNYSIRTDKYDVIIGYRADDSYFSYAGMWVSNTIPVSTLQTALYLGELGEQVVLKSEKAFERLKHVGVSPAMREEYYPKFLARDSKARSDLFKLINKTGYKKSDIYAMDIVREEMPTDDPRLQQYVCRRRV